MSKQYAIGLDLGGTSIKYGICSDDGEIVSRFKRPSHADKDADVVLEQLVAAAKEAQEFADSKGIKLEALGIGTPGSVDVKTGYLKGGTPNFKYWRNVAIKDRLESSINLPVFADNDANVMAYGEMRYGAGEGCKDIVCITLGTGIGGGIIIDGNLFRGSNYAGSEVGHMSIHYDGKRCRCGGIGCWEKYASATAMIDHYRELNPDSDVSSTIGIFERYAGNENAAIEVVERGASMVAAGLASLVNIFNPQRIIIGGGVSEAGDWYIAKIKRETCLRSMEPAQEGLEVVAARLGNKAGLLGAAGLALDMQAAK
ncbi:MAG: ROK family protein [Calditrichia bacterium]